jgi:general secretion pathway protein G
VKRELKRKAMKVFNLKLKRSFRGKTNSAAARAPHSAFGFTLIELVVTLVVLSILALGTVPLMQNAVRRQKEQRLRETLRDVRQAIDEFKRDATGACDGSAGAGGAGGGRGPFPPPNNGNAGSDPRTRVMISDCKIFEVDNLDRYPPTLETLIEGVTVKPRVGQVLGPNGGPFDNPRGATGDKPDGATGNSATEEKKKVYLREMPVDPITGKSDWKIRSCYQDKDATEWDNINVFDVRSAAEGEALDGTKYSDF